MIYLCEIKTEYSNSMLCKHMIVQYRPFRKDQQPRTIVNDDFTTMMNTFLTTPETSNMHLDTIEKRLSKYNIIDQWSTIELMRKDYPEYFI